MSSPVYLLGLTEAELRTLREALMEIGVPDGGLLVRIDRKIRWIEEGYVKPVSDVE